MKVFRAVWKGILFLLLSLGFYLTWLVVFPLLLPFRQAARRWRGFIFRTWAVTMLRLLGAKLTVRGTPPRPPFFLVSNHLSYVDVIVLAAQLDCVFVAKSDIAHWPLFGLFSRSFNTIFIDRSNRQDIPRVNALIENVMHQGWGVVVFPEGTSTRGAEVWPFRTSLLEPPARAGWPVSYASLSYRTRPHEAPAEEAVCWWGEMQFLPHLFGLLQLTGFDARLTFGETTIQETDRKLLATKLHAAVRNIFTPVADKENACVEQRHQVNSLSGH